MSENETKSENVQVLETFTMSEAQRKARGRRNAAIGIGLALMVCTFYAATVVKFGPKLMDRPIITLGN